MKRIASLRWLSLVIQWSLASQYNAYYTRDTCTIKLSIGEREREGAGTGANLCHTEILFELKYTIDYNTIQKYFIHWIFYKNIFRGVFFTIKCNNLGYTHLLIHYTFIIYLHRALLLKLTISSQIYLNWNYSLNLCSKWGSALAPDYYIFFSF